MKLLMERMPIILSVDKYNWRLNVILSIKKINITILRVVAKLFENLGFTRTFMNRNGKIKEPIWSLIRNSSYTLHAILIPEWT